MANERNPRAGAKRANATLNPAAPASTAKRTGYSACIYVHGMGSQRRFEESCRLIDRIDAWVGCKTYPTGYPIRRLENVDTRVEPPRETGDPDLAFVKADLVEGSGKSAVREAARFYEVYWAPVMAGQGSATAVFRWIMSQVLRPFATLGSPWRERPRLRRSTLTAMYEAEHPVIAQSDYAALMSHYHNFESMEAQRAYPAGDFEEFLLWIEDEERRPARPGRSRGSDPAALRDKVRRLRELALRWYRLYRASERRNSFVLITLALAIIVIAAGGIWLTAALILWVKSLVAGTGVAEFATAILPTKLEGIASLFVSLTLAFGLGRFLTNYMADVQAWATFAETDEKFERREKVIETGKRVMRHVLEDPDCKRVTIVAHSLGTPIAQDVLLALARYNRARNPHGDEIVYPIPLAKIDHFVTIGSPIDKIEYFFESMTSASHRYKRYYESMRGDIGTPPFSRNKDPYIHWINFWDDGDLVSGALHSPANRSGAAQRVDNVHVESLTFPSPGPSHSAYFVDRRVIDILTDVIFKGTHSFLRLPLVDRPGSPDRSPDYASVRIGPLDPPGRRRFWHWLALAVPWLSVAAIAAKLLALHCATLGLASLAVGLCVLLVCAAIRGKWHGARFAIPKRYVVEEGTEEV